MREVSISAMGIFDSYPLHHFYPCEIYLSVSHKGTDGLDLVIHHLLGEARVGSKEEGLIHDDIGARHLPDHTESFRAILAELNEDRLTEEIAPEEHAVTDFLRIEMTREIGVGEGC